MPWHLHLALRHLFPARRPPSFFAFASAVGVALGVMVLVVVLSVMGGFGTEVRQKIIDAEGDVRVVSRSILYGWEPLAEELAARPGVAAVAPFAEGIVMVQHDGRPFFPGIRGIDVERERGVTPFERFLLVGSLDDLDDDSLLVGTGVAEALGLTVGSRVDIYSPLMIERLKRDSVLLPRELRVAGVFETGWHEVDGRAVVGTLRLMQDLYGLDRGVHGVTLRLEPGVDAVAFADALQPVLGADLRAMSWLDRNRNFQFVLRLERTVMSFLLAAILLVSAFAIASSLWVAVVRKTREIGLLGAMGGGRAGIALCFCWQGLVLGVAGTALGIVLGLLFLHYRDGIVTAVVRAAGVVLGAGDERQAMLQYYGFANLPVHVAFADFAGVAVFSVVLSVLAGLLPAWRASQLRPAEALRSE